MVVTICGVSSRGREWWCGVGWVRSVYLYAVLRVSMGAGGSRVTMQTPIDEFPLFYIRDAWEYPDHPAGAGQ